MEAAESYMRFMVLGGVFIPLIFEIMSAMKGKVKPFNILGGIMIAIGGFAAAYPEIILDATDHFSVMILFLIGLIGVVFYANGDHAKETKEQLSKKQQKKQKEERIKLAEEALRLEEERKELRKEVLTLKVAKKKLRTFHKEILKNKAIVSVLGAGKIAADKLKDIAEEKQRAERRREYTETVEAMFEAEEEVDGITLTDSEYEILDLD